MKQQYLVFGMIASAVLLTATQSHAQSRNCADRQAVVERLTTKYGETRQSIGLANNNAVIEVFASSDSGSWTITVTNTQGVTCLVAAGRSFERLDEAMTPAMLGEPA